MNGGTRTKTKLKLGALGGPNTFGAEAAHRMRELYPEFGEIVYFETSDEALLFQNGSSDGLCAPQQMARTGPHPGIQGTIAGFGSNRYVLAEVTHEYHCSLLAKPGTKLEQIRKVLGHTGSVTQSRQWLNEHLPHAEIVIVHTSSMGAAAEVKDSDGSLASIGTPGMAKQYALEQLARDIDNFSVGAYWAISPHALFVDRPTRLVIAGRLDDHGVAAIVAALGKAGFGLQSVFSTPSGRRLYEYDYALRFGGAGDLADVHAAVVAVPGARLAGAFEARE